MSHNPNASQLSKLATLKATVASTAATLASAQAALSAAQAANNNALVTFKEYEYYIYGGKAYPGTIDGGSAESV